MAKRDKAEVLRIERLAVGLRLAKRSYDEIAATIDPDTGTRLFANRSAARKAVIRAMERDVSVDAGPLLLEEIGRLDAATRAIWDNVLRGQLPAIDRMLAIQRQLTTLVPGLAAASRVEHSGPGGAPLEVVTSWPAPNLSTIVVDEDDLAVPQEAASARVPPKL